MGFGRGAGATRAMDAARMAISSPLLNDGLGSAGGVLLNITGATDLALSGITEAATIVAEVASPDATIIFGALIDPRLAHEVTITLVASGGPPHGQLQGGPAAPGRGAPPSPAPLGARLPRRPRAPGGHVAATLPPSPDPQERLMSYLKAGHSSHS